MNHQSYPNLKSSQTVWELLFSKLCIPLIYTGLAMLCFGSVKSQHRMEVSVVNTGFSGDYGRNYLSNFPKVQGFEYAYSLPLTQHVAIGFIYNHAQFTYGLYKNKDPLKINALLVPVNILIGKVKKMNRYNLLELKVGAGFGKMFVEGSPFSEDRVMEAFFYHSSLYYFIKKNIGLQGSTRFSKLFSDGLDGSISGNSFDYMGTYALGVFFVFD